MKRCNYCGKAKEEIVISTLLDGLVCRECSSKYFKWSPDQRVVPINYDRESLMNTLFGMPDEMRHKLLMQLKDIQARYVCRIKQFTLEKDSISIQIDSLFRRKKAVIVLVAKMKAGKAAFSIMTTPEKKAKEDIKHTSKEEVNG